MRKRILQPASKALPSIQAAFEQFQKQNQLKNLSQGTIDFYSSKARHFFNFLENTDQPIDSITEETVVDYIFHLKEKQLHDTTINTYLRMVRAFLYWCMDKGYLEHFSIQLPTLATNWSACLKLRTRKPAPLPSTAIGS